MSIRFRCENADCRRGLWAPDELAGRMGKCTRCATPVRIPEPESPPAAPLAPRAGRFADAGPAVAARPPRARRVERRPERDEPAGELEKLEAVFRSKARAGGASGVAFGVLCLLAAVGAASVVDNEAAGVLIGLACAGVGATFMTLGVFTWRQWVGATFALTVLAIGWAVLNLIGLVVVLVTSGQFSPGLGLLILGWLCTATSQAADAASKFRKAGGRSDGRRVPWVGLGVSGALALLVSVAVVAVGVSRMPSGDRPTSTSGWGGDSTSASHGAASAEEGPVTWAGEWTAPTAEGVQVRGVRIDRNDFPCDGEVRVGRKGGVRFEEANTEFPFGGHRVRVRDRDDVEMACPVRWRQDGAELVATQPAGGAEVARVRLSGRNVVGEVRPAAAVRALLKCAERVEVPPLTKTGAAPAAGPGGGAQPAGAAAPPAPEADDKPAEAAKPDPELDGTWRLSQVYDLYDGGTKSYLLVTSKYVMTIKGKEMTVESGDEGKTTTTKCTLEVDQSKEPKQYKQTRAGDKDAKPTVGIYEVEKDTLRMCFQADGQPPEGFTVKRDDGKDRCIYEFVRVKK